jgi:transmembrane sensor
MTENTRRKKAAGNPATREAAAWFARLRADDVSEQDRARFEQWLAADPQHRRAYAGFERFWTSSGDYAGDRRVAEATCDAARAAKTAEAEAIARNVKAGTQRTRETRRRTLAMAASVCVTALALVFLLLWPRTNQTYQTGIGEQRSVMLADGSRITLNTDSRLRVSYSESTRTVRLEHGQAYFRVAKESRPFEVETGNGVVRAVGTAFDVYRRDEGVVVTVAEGTVMVTDTVRSPTAGARAIPEKAAKVLHAGERVALTHGAQLQEARVETAPVERSVAWLGGKLMFDAEPLDRAVAEINRYSTQQVMIGDDRINTLQMSGVFRVGETDDFVRAVSDYFSLRIEADGNGNYVLYARPTS